MDETAKIEIRRGDGVYSFECFDTDYSKGISRSILNGETYPALPFIGDVRTVVDIGANVGAASVYFSLNYPLADVYAYEPDPRSFDLLRRNAERVPRIRLENVGLFSADCRKLLYDSNFDSVTASVRTSILNRGTGTEVVLRDAAAVLAAIPQPDIIKIDTEGCEVPILYAARDIAANSKVVYVEYHSETDRRIIDCLLGPTHILVRGGASNPHRGEFCYVRRDAFAGTNELFQLEIKS